MLGLWLGEVKVPCTYNSARRVKRRGEPTTGGWINRSRGVDTRRARFCRPAPMRRGHWPAKAGVGTPCGEFPPRRSSEGKAVRAAAGGGRLPGTRAPRELGGDGGELAESGEALERLALELANALAREPELGADRLERPRIALEPEAQLEDAPLALGERVERLADALLAQRLLGLVERVRGLAVGEEIAELALVVGADALVQRDGRLRGRRAPRRRAGSGGRWPRPAPRASRRGRARPRAGARRGRASAAARRRGRARGSCARCWRRRAARTGGSTRSRTWRT